MADIAHPLLAAEGGDGELGTKKDASTAGAGPRPWKRWAAAGLLLVTTSGFLFVAARARARAPGAASTLAAPTNLLSGWGNASCYTPTGGTCMIYDCDSVRGATCGTGHNCYCAEGCTGADGICRSRVESYKLVASNVRFRNVKYSDQYMYAPRSWFMEQLRVTDAKGEYADLWNIYKLPGKDFIWHQDMYFLSPVEFPEYVAGIANTKMAAYIPSKSGNSNSGGFVIPVGSLFTVDLYHLTSRHLLENRNPFNIAVVMNTLCKPRDRPDAVEISGALGQATWYIHHASWEVFGWVWSEPGPAGQWVVEPPLDTPLPWC